jgi:hypothetical protein
MKRSILPILFVVLLISSTVTQNDIYKKDIIKIINKNVGHAGEFKEGVITNEAIEMDIYIKDFSVDNAKKVCGYYKNFYSEKAKKLKDRLTLEINVWSKKISASDIIKTPDLNVSPAAHKEFFKSAKWKQYLKLEQDYYHGGTIYNYANGAYNEDIY